MGIIQASEQTSSRLPYKWKPRQGSPPPFSTWAPLTQHATVRQRRPFDRCHREMATPQVRNHNHNLKSTFVPSSWTFFDSSVKLYLTILQAIWESTSLFGQLLWMLIAATLWSCYMTVSCHRITCITQWELSAWHFINTKSPWTSDYGNW